MSLKRKLFTAVSMFALTCAMLLVGVWAVSSTSIEIGGTISFSATNVNATVSGSITGASAGTITPTTLEYSSSKTPTTEALNSWKNNLSFDEAGSKITMTITVNNLSSERKLYVTLTDTVGDVTNLSKTVKNGANAYTSGTEVEIATSGNTTFTIEFTVGSTDISTDGNYGYNVNLRDESFEVINEASSYTNLRFMEWGEGKTLKVAGNNSSMTSVEIPAKVLYNGETYTVTAVACDGFSGYKNLQKVVLPYTILFVGNCSFNGCSALTDVNFPEGFCSFGLYDPHCEYCGEDNCFSDSAFASCTALENIVLPTTLTDLGTCSFVYCTNLKSVTLLATSVVNHGTDPFNSVENVVIYVPADLVDDYKADGGWSSFDIQPIA